MSNPVDNIRGASTEGLSKLPLSTTLPQLLAYSPESIALKEFAEKRSLPAKLRETEPKQIAKELKDAKLDEARITAVLEHLPDRERANVRFWLGDDTVYAPTRGFPKVVYQHPKLRRKKSKSKDTTRIEPGIITPRL